MRPFAALSRREHNPESVTTESADPHREHGFTLVEVIMSMGVIGVTAIPTAGVFMSSFSASAEAVHRDAAVGVATSGLGNIQSLPYAEIGCYADQVGYQATYSVGSTTYNTVAIATTTPVGYTPPIVPQRTQTVGAITYTITTNIVWTDASGVLSGDQGTYANAYKAAYVTATWNESGSTDTVTESSLVASPTAGPCSTSNCTSGTGQSYTPYTPNDLQVVVPSGSAGETELVGSWQVLDTFGSCPGYFVVSWSTQAGDTLHPQSSSTDQQVASCPSGYTWTYTMTGLASGTTYYVWVTSYSPDGSQQESTGAQVSAETSTSSSSTCVPESLSVSGVTSGSTTKTYLKQDGAMSEDLKLTYATSGPCSGPYTVTSVLGGTSTDDPGSPYNGVLTSASGGVFTATLPTGTDNQLWALGDHTFTVQDADNTGHTFLVCAYTTTPSSSPTQC
jgi:prepilin-type N-terminal cleavage/methylation domain-containing protein